MIIIKRLRFTVLIIYFIFFLCLNGLARKVVKPYTDYPEVKGASHFVTKMSKCPKGYSYDPKFEIRNVWQKINQYVTSAHQDLLTLNIKGEEKCIRCRLGWIYDGKSKCIKMPLLRIYFKNN